MSTPSVRIRMYRQGLGDCFLLTLPTQDGSPRPEFHMLIDCGLITGGDTKKMIAVVEEILATTGGHLDLVVGTHEHWDHLSGFIFGKDLFDKQFQIDNVWLAWTEDPQNKVARDMRKDRSARLTALKAALSRMTGVASALPADSKEKDLKIQEMQSIQNILSFFGEDGPVGDFNPSQTGSEGVGLAADGGGTTQSAMLYLASRSDARIHYCYPSGDPLALAGVAGARVYIFGPPEDTKMLKRSDAVPSQKSKQTYGLSVSNSQDSFMAALDATANNGDSSLFNPFDDDYRIKPEDARNPEYDDFYRQAYGFDKTDEAAWRRIDSDWLNVTSELALSLDSDTNNTSLVMAIELGEPGMGKVLLFAADAQVGSWQTWEGLEWLIKNGVQPPLKVFGSDLMARTVLYKVGHHGSHNATLREGGLELMTSDELVAMIPVDEKAALNRKWKMPFDKLYDRLSEKTRGRVLRLDMGLPDRKLAALLTEHEWQVFSDLAKEETLYIEFTVR
jgi:hypothetical protein